MIMRMVRIAVPRTDEDRVVATLRRQAAAAPRPGLLRSTFATSRAGDRVEFVLTTIWTTERAMIQAVAADAELPDASNSFSDVVLDSTVDYLTVIADG